MSADYFLTTQHIQNHRCDPIRTCSHFMHEWNVWWEDIWERTGKYNENHRLRCRGWQASTFGVFLPWNGKSIGIGEHYVINGRTEQAARNLHRCAQSLDFDPLPVRNSLTRSTDGPAAFDVEWTATSAQQSRNVSSSWKDQIGLLNYTCLFTVWWIVVFINLRFSIYF